jgi:hypothetical protein
MNTRETIKATCLEILNGTKKGDMQAAEITYGHLVWLDTRDLLLGKTSDADANAEVVALIKAAKAAA